MEEVVVEKIIELTQGKDAVAKHEQMKRDADLSPNGLKLQEPQPRLVNKLC